MNLWLHFPEGLQRPQRVCSWRESLAFECVSSFVSRHHLQSSQACFTADGEASLREPALGVVRGLPFHSGVAGHLTQHKPFQSDSPFELIQFGGKASSCASVHPAAPSAVCSGPGGQEAL